MAELELESPTLRAVWSHYEAAENRPGNRIGVSWLGTPCARQLWYKFRWAAQEKFDGRMRRLFLRGHEEELKVYIDLLCAGLTVMPGPGFRLHLHPQERTRNNATLALQSFVAAGLPQFPMTTPEGHIGGYADGACFGVLEAPETWHMLEIKTHSSNSFGKIRAQGIQQAKPQHWVQCHVGMRLLGLDRCLYIAVNKDNDDMIYTRIRLERDLADAAIARGNEIAFAEEAPPRIAEDPDSEDCQYCPFNNMCFSVSEAVPEVSCRSCVWAQAINGGGWHCSRHHKELSVQAQKDACDRHLYIPSMFPDHEVLEGTEDYVEYTQVGSGIIWRNGIGKECTPSKLLKEQAGWLPF